MFWTSTVAEGSAGSVVGRDPESRWDKRFEAREAFLVSVAAEDFVGTFGRGPLVTETDLRFLRDALVLASTVAEDGPGFKPGGVPLRASAGECFGAGGAFLASMVAEGSVDSSPG